VILDWWNQTLRIWVVAHRERHGDEPQELTISERAALKAVENEVRELRDGRRSVVSALQHLPPGRREPCRVPYPGDHCQRVPGVVPRVALLNSFLCAIGAISGWVLLGRRPGRAVRRRSVAHGKTVEDDVQRPVSYRFCVRVRYVGESLDQYEHLLDGDVRASSASRLRALQHPPDGILEAS